jgi:hypothetical protein
MAWLLGPKQEACRESERIIAPTSARSIAEAVESRFLHCWSERRPRRKGAYAAVSGVGRSTAAARVEGQNRLIQGAKFGCPFIY